MGRSTTNTGTDTTDLADQVAQSLGMGPKPAGGGQPKPKPVKQKPVDIADQVGQSLGLKKKVGGDESSPESSPTPSPLPSPEQAAQAFQNKTLTPESVNVLAQTDQGKKMGLNLLSPKEQQMFASAHNGEKKADVVDGVMKVVDTYYPASNDPAKNTARTQIIQAVQSGKQPEIKKLRDSVISDLQKKINDIQTEARGGEVYDRSNFRGLWKGFWESHTTRATKEN